MYNNIRNTFGTNLTFFFVCTCIYVLCSLCIVICMHSFYSAHIFIVCDSVICTTHSIFDYGHIIIVLNYKAHIVYSPLNSYVYIHWILDFKYVILFIYQA